VYGNDYKTRDGTCIRDYIDIIDLAKAHIKAIDFIKVTNGFHIFNIGTNKGLSVLEIIHLFETVLNTKLNYKFSKRRMGDVESCYANAKKANKIFKNTEEVERQHSQMQEKIQEIIHSNNNNKEEKIIKAYEDMQKLINI
jgi:UDP-glucose 4-epimerase